MLEEYSRWVEEKGKQDLQKKMRLRKARVKKSQWKENWRLKKTGRETLPSSHEEEFLRKGSGAEIWPFYDIPTLFCQQYSGKQTIALSHPLSLK
jgi:hypothetical protein